MKTSTTIGSIFEILERNLYNAILRIASPGERINAAMVYETIWTWFIKDFENEKAGITDAIQKGEYARKLMNPKSGKDILPRCIGSQPFTRLSGRARGSNRIL